MEVADSFSLSADSGTPWFIDAPDHVGSEGPVTLRGWLVRAEHSGASTSLLRTRGAPFGCAQSTSSRSLDCRSLPRWPRPPSPILGLCLMLAVPLLLLPPVVGPRRGRMGVHCRRQAESFAGVCRGDRRRPCCPLCFWAPRPRRHSLLQSDSVV